MSDSAIRSLNYIDLKFVPVVVSDCPVGVGLYGDSRHKVEGAAPSQEVMRDLGE